MSSARFRALPKTPQLRHSSSTLSQPAHDVPLYLAKTAWAQSPPQGAGQQLSSSAPVILPGDLCDCSCPERRGQSGFPNPTVAGRGELCIHAPQLSQVSRALTFLQALGAHRGDCSCKSKPPVSRASSRSNALPGPEGEVNRLLSQSSQRSHTVPGRHS